MFNVTSGDNRNTLPVEHRLAIAFTSGALDTNNNARVHQNFILVNGLNSITMDVRTDRFFLSASKGAPAFSCLAGLTMIETGMQPIMTGSLEGVYSGVG